MFLPIIATPIAENTITQGNSTSTVTVQTTSNGNSTTHIETNVNGNDQIYNSTNTGSIHIENTGNTYSITVSPAATTSPTSMPPVKLSVSFWQHVKNFFKNFLKFF